MTVGTPNLYYPDDITRLSYPSLQCPRCKLEFPANRTLVMGVLNITPDSFSDGGSFFSVNQAIAHALQMVQDGADIIDIGGESSRPGATPVTTEEEISRIVPVIERIVKETNIPISVDTYKAKVAKAAIDAGTQIINDITAMTSDPEMFSLAARTGVPIILMHMQGSPQTMQLNPQYQNVISDIKTYLNNVILNAKNNGINENKIIIDPGIGFGKTIEHNLTILKHLSDFLVIGRPVLIGVSRKSFIGKILDLPVEQRFEGTAAAVTISVLNGAKIVRVHDVKEMVRVVKIADAIRTAK